MNVGDSVTNPNFIEGVRRIIPGVSFLTDVIVRDNSDGNGPILVAWNIANPIPTDTDIANAMAAPRPDTDITGPLGGSATGVLLKVILNHENRLRALEGKPTVTMAQLVTALKSLLP